MFHGIETTILNKLATADIAIVSDIDVALFLETKKTLHIFPQGFAQDHFRYRNIKCVRSVGYLGTPKTIDQYQMLQDLGIDFTYELPKFEWPDYINSTDINIMFDTDPITKAYEILACKGFLLTQKSIDLDLAFREHIDYVPFDTYGDLIDQLDKFSDNKRAKNKIKRHGYAVANNYSMLKWANFILEKCNI